MEGSREDRWSENVESVRKDVECIFGILKKRFLILKHPIRLAKEQQIERLFVTCCVLHNLLLEYDGLDAAADVEVTSSGALERAGEECARRSKYYGGISGVRSANREEYGQEITNDVGESGGSEGCTTGYTYTNNITESQEHRKRRDGLIEHLTFWKKHVRNERNGMGRRGTE